MRRIDGRLSTNKPDHGVVRFELNPSPVRTGSSILKGTVPVRFGAVRCDADPVRFGAGSVPRLWRRPKAASFVLALNIGHILLLRRKTCLVESQDICLVETQDMCCVES